MFLFFVLFSGISEFEKRFENVIHIFLYYVELFSFIALKEVKSGIVN